MVLTSDKNRVGAVALSPVFRHDKESIVSLGGNK